MFVTRSFKFIFILTMTITTEIVKFTFLNIIIFLM